MIRVAVIAFDGVVSFDLTISIEAFGRVQLPDGQPAYEVRVCGVTPEVDAGAIRVRAPYSLREVARADVVILPGTTNIERPIAPALIRAVQRAAGRGARIASICSGAFLLAATGLLAGRRATTHWLAAEALARRYPDIQVDANVLYVDEGQILTSAGAAAGLDLCLHMIRRDYGATVAADAARLSVVPLERAGGQAQFIPHATPPAEAASLGPLLAWLEGELARDVSLAQIARRAAMSVRSLSRHFKAETGVTPIQWLLRARVRRAQSLLETTRWSIERVASESGFTSMASFREQFHRAASTSPLAYRRAFSAATPAMKTS